MSEKNPVDAAQVWEWVRWAALVVVTLLAPFLDQLLG